MKVVKKNPQDLKSVLIELQFKKGKPKIIRVVNPESMLLSYNQKNPKDCKEDEIMGGFYTMGSPFQLRFLLFMLIKQMLDVLGKKSIIDIFNRIMGVIARQNMIDKKLNITNDGVIKN